MDSVTLVFFCIKRTVPLDNYVTGKIISCSYRFNPFSHTYVSGVIKGTVFGRKEWTIFRRILLFDKLLAKRWMENWNECQQVKACVKGNRAIGRENVFGMENKGIQSRRVLPVDTGTGKFQIPQGFLQSGKAYAWQVYVTRTGDLPLDYSGLSDQHHFSIKDD